MGKTPDFGLPFFYRVILPGTVVTISAFPLLSPFLSNLGIGGKDQTPYLIGISVAFGFVLSLFGDPIYQLLEGRFGWPHWLVAWRTKRWTKLVEVKMARQKELDQQDPEYKECWYLLRQFPVDANGDPTALQPSRIGNVISAYEQYPKVRYGMDSVFYWPRLWLLIDKDVREEIDSPWAAVDSILYAGFGAAVVGVLYAILAVSFGLGIAAGLPGFSSVAAVGLLIAGLVLVYVFLLCIQLSVPGLVANGENFKSVFDLYRSKLTLSAASDQEKQDWLRLGNQLQYGVDEGGPPEK